MDKRVLARLFQGRLNTLLMRTSLTQSAFASSVEIDRSALSQLLAGQSTRLPRAETLLKMAERFDVSLDWLLGISQDEGITGRLQPSFEIEAEQAGTNGETLLEKWHAEAAGTKIRYVPMRLPDLVRTQDVIAYETAHVRLDPKTQISETVFRLDYNRQPGTDMEVCMPKQTLEEFAAGHGVWRDLPRIVRQRQLEHVVSLLDELYPSFRLYLFDGRARYSVPYTVFGPYRAAIFVGKMYLVLNAKESVLSMQKHFDDLIRIAQIHAHEASVFVAGLKSE